MKTIEKTVKYIRSKNAGPFWQTIDAFCYSPEDAKSIYDTFEKNRDWIAEVFNVKAEEILLFYLPHINVTKLSYPRRPIQGNKEERDMHGGQQYVTLLDLEVV